MRVGRDILAVALVLNVAVPVCADMSDPTSVTTALADVTAGSAFLSPMAGNLSGRPRSTLPHQCPANSRRDERLDDPMAPALSASVHPGDPSIAADSPVVHELPAGPGSMSLFLWALAGFGAARLGWSASHVHLGHAPEWFHVNAPYRVGRATVTDLRTGHLPVSVFDDPAEDDTDRSGSSATRLSGDVRQAQHFLASHQMRGPPLRCPQRSIVYVSTPAVSVRAFVGWVQRKRVA